MYLILLSANFYLAQSLTYYKKISPENSCILHPTFEWQLFPLVSFSFILLEFWRKKQAFVQICLSPCYVIKDNLSYRLFYAVLNLACFFHLLIIHSGALFILAHRHLPHLFFLKLITQPFIEPGTFCWTNNATMKKVLYKCHFIDAELRLWGTITEIQLQNHIC